MIMFYIFQKLKTSVLVVFFCLITFFSYADSILESSKDDSFRIEKYIVFPTKQDSIVYANEINRIESIKINTIVETYARTINFYANIYKSAGLFELSLELYNTTLFLRMQTGNQSKIQESYTNIGTLYYTWGKFEKSIEYFFQSLHIVSKLGLKKQTSIALNNLGVVFYTLNRLKKAQQCYTQALEIDKSINDKVGLARDYNNLGVINSTKGQLTSAMANYNAALTIYQELGMKSESIDAIGNIALIYRDVKQFDISLKYLYKTYELAKEVGDMERIILYFSNSAEIYYQIKNYEKAENYYITALDLSRKNKLLQNELDINLKLANLYKKTSNYSLSLNHFEAYMKLKDTLFSEKAMEKIVEYQTRFESQQKENQIELLNKEKKIQALEIETQKSRKNFQLIISIAAIIFILVIMLSLYNRYKFRQQQIMKQTLLEQEKLRFIAVIDTQEKERIRIARDLHDSLGQILSTAKLNVSGLEEYIGNNDVAAKIHKNSSDLIDEACKEVRNISHNIMPSTLIKLGLKPAIRDLVRKISESNKINIEFFAEGNENRLSETIEISLFRIIQELTNNIIKHSQAQNVSIKYNQTESFVNIEIEEDGNPLNQDNIENSKGIGWKNIYSRLSMIDGVLKIKSLSGIGNRFSLVIKLK